MEIYKKMIEVMRDSDFIGKDRTNSQQGFKFRGIDDVMNALHSSMAKAGIFILTEAIGEPIITEKQTKTGGTLFYTRQKWQFTFCAEDGSTVKAVTIGEAMDSGDKGMNKSMSIALKYALLQSFLIPTEEDKDPDAHSHDIIPPPAPKPRNKLINPLVKEPAYKPLMTKEHAAEAYALCESLGVEVVDILQELGRKSFEEMTDEKYDGLIKFIEGKK